MYLSIKIELRPNETQKKIFNQSFGYSRYIYNKALDKWKELWEDYQKDKTLKKPTHRRVRDELKKDKEDWEDTQLKQVLDTSCEDLGKAFNMMWKGHGKYPKYKSKRNEKFTARFYRKNDYSLQIKGAKCNKLKLSGLDSLIHMKESLNYDYSSIQEVTLSKKADKYFASIVMKFDDINNNLIDNKKFVGIDLGEKDFAIINDSNGKFKKYKNINKKLLLLYERLENYQRIISRKQKDSNKYNVTRIKIQRTYMRISNIKKDYLNKISSHIIENYQYITIEDLKVSNMVKNKNLSKQISRNNWREFRAMLERKAEFNGNTIIVADQWFPSTQLCSSCGNILTGENKLGRKRWYKCKECNHSMDRDYNASVNLKKYGMRSVGQAN